MELNIYTGKPLPESYEDFCELLARRDAHNIRCLDCRKPFEPSNVKTREGWRETQIGGTCEMCFDSLFDGEENME